MVFSWKIGATDHASSQLLALLSREKYFYLDLTTEDRLASRNDAVDYY